MMDLKETLSVSIDALRANKLRAMLTSLGVIIGSASIVLVVTVALTSKKFVDLADRSGRFERGVGGADQFVTEKAQPLKPTS